MNLDEKIKTIIEKLKKKYPVFVSERHLQVAFSIEAEKVIKGCKLYPEDIFNPKTSKSEKSKNRYIDLVIEKESKKVAFEFKYIVCDFEADINKRHIKLRHQSAWPGRRYDCLKDIERLEILKKEKDKDKRIDEGYFVLITNYKGFCERKNKEKVVKDEEFRFESGIKKGTKKWAKDTGGMKNGRENSITISHDYDVNFELYNNVKTGKGNTEFKVLVLKI